MNSAAEGEEEDASLSSSNSGESDKALLLQAVENAINEAGLGGATTTNTSAGTISAAAATSKKRKRSPKSTKKQQPSSAKAKQPGKLELRWNSNYQALEEYKQQHGNVNIMRKHYEIPDGSGSGTVKLGEWLFKQKREYRNGLEGKKSVLSAERAARLEQLGVEWDRTKSVLGWEGTYEVLKRYRERHGHCRVPQHYVTADDDDGNEKGVCLGTWVLTQRREAKKRLEGQPSRMTADRVAKLDALDFEWDAANTLWHRHWELLRDYHREHGTCQVPQSYEVVVAAEDDDDEGNNNNNNATTTTTIELGKWVHRQRFEYRRRQSGLPSPMTQARINELNVLSFEWGAASRYPWEDYLQALQQYKQEHGNCEVPEKYKIRPTMVTAGNGGDSDDDNDDDEAGGHNPNNNTDGGGHGMKLGLWIREQRKQAKAFQEGRPAWITAQRLEALVAVGLLDATTLTKKKPKAVASAAAAAKPKPRKTIDASYVKSLEKQVKQLQREKKAHLREIDHLKRQLDDKKKKKAKSTTAMI